MAARLFRAFLWVSVRVCSQCFTGCVCEVAWENGLFDLAFGRAFRGESDPPSPIITDAHLNAAAMFGVHRFAIGQVILDNDIARAAWKIKQEEDPRDARMAPVDKASRARLRISIADS